MRFSIIGALALASVTGTTVHADTLKPSVPTNVSATALGDSSIRVTWNKPYDNVGIAGYNVYRNRNYYATVHGTTTFIDRSAREGQSYEYAIVAFDAARNYTVLSSADGASVGGGSTGAAPRSSSNGETPAIPDGVSARSAGGGGIKVSWNEASGNVAGYNVYRNDSYRITVRGTTEWTDTDTSPGSEYRYQVVAFSGDAKFSRRSESASASADGAVAADDAAPAPAPSSSSDSVPAGYRLVFAEEFNGNSIDSSKWNSSYRWGPNWTINNEQQYYVDTVNNPDFGYQPFEFGGGKMSITAKRTPDALKSSANNKSYLSGALTTFDKFKMKYGYVEMRAKMPGGQGLWPALWLLNQRDDGNRPEIDIMEFLGRDVDTIYNVYHHYRGYNLRSTPSFEASGPDYTADFHTFGVKWESGRIIWYVDGREVNRYENSDVSNEEMYLIVNLALGGAWGGNVDGSTPFPARYTIDYIRAYQR